MDKQFMFDQLAERIRASAEVATREHEAAAAEAKEGATADEKRADARVALEFSNLAHAQGERARAALQDLAVLERFRAPAGSERINLGSIVEVEDGDDGRTLLLAPVGAGIELTMPGGDGYLTVVTTSSPLGRALIGQGLDDTVEISVAGQPREWTVTYIS